MAENIRDVTTLLPEPATCPLRMSGMGPWGYKEGLDGWRQYLNGERICTFCGSLHPDDFMNLVADATKEGAEVEIEPSTKDYKVYVNRPSVKNAFEGGIKFYKQHFVGEPTEEQTATFRQAIAISRARLQARFSA